MRGLRTGLVPVILAPALLAAAGCSSYRAPGVQIADVTVTEQTGEALTLRFDLDLHNPNGEPLELVSFDYAASVNGRAVYEGRWSAQATLSPGGTKRVGIPAVVRFDLAGWEEQGLPAAARCAVSGRLLYVTPGELAEVLLDTGVRRPSASFKGSGEVVLRAPADG